ncbi:MAG: hypothetical protein K6A94_07365 [Bacteroidales bacterium]|nr:hypothetical protein [Bacteroidales bacterium]
MATTKTSTTQKKTTAKKSSSTTTKKSSTSSTRKKRKTSGTQIIPGVSINISWKRLLGITKLKQWFTKKTGIPTTEAGLQRKIGKWAIDLITGKGKDKEQKKTEKFSDNGNATNGSITTPPTGSFIDTNQENAQ